MSFKHNSIITYLRRTIGAGVKALIYCALNLIYSDLPQDKASILMYHSIDKNPVFFTVRPSVFAQQMAYLAQNNYNVVSLQKLAFYIKDGNIPGKTVVLTFDDGHEDNYFNAFPVLKKYNFPATIFLATGFMGKKIPNSANFSLPALNWQQLKEMQRSGLIDFQPHTVSHPKLNYVSLREAEKEILSSKRCIEENLQKACRFFVYPKGYYTVEIEQLLRRQGFLLALTIEEGLVSLKDNPFLLKRNSIDSSVNFCQFKGKISKSVEIFRKIFRA